MMDNMENKYDYTFESIDTPAQAAPDAQPAQSPSGAAGAERKRSHRSAKRTVALVLALALVCGGAGFGGAALYGRLRPSVTDEQEDAAPAGNIGADAMTALTGREMTPEALYEAVLPSCVGITVSTTVNIFGQSTPYAASGSGFVLTADGYIATNYHVIEEAAENTGVDIEVSFADGQKYDAELVGGDETNDVAVVKIEAEGLTPVTLGDSGSLKVGEPVYTVGNPLGELTFSLTDGIVSALDRVISTENNVSMNMLQTNCAINPGNSGGPLFDAAGRVVGIVTAKYTNASSNVSAEGLGFAIPLDDVKNMFSDIIEYGYVTGKPLLGVTVSTVSSAMRRYGIPQGAAVEDVTAGSCAEKAGIAVGDIITALDGRTVDTKETLTAALSAKRAGDEITVTVYRQGETLELKVTLDERTSVTETQTEPEETQPQETDPDSGYGFGFPWDWFFGGSDDYTGRGGNSGSGRGNGENI